jgi:hypothetical protein
MLATQPKIPNTSGCEEQLLREQTLAINLPSVCHCAANSPYGQHFKDLSVDQALNATLPPPCRAVQFRR